MKRNGVCNRCCQPILVQPRTACSELRVDPPETYYGMLTPAPVFKNRREAQFDYSGSENVYSHYEQEVMSCAIPFRCGRFPRRGSTGRPGH